MAKDKSQGRPTQATKTTEAVDTKIQKMELEAEFAAVAVKIQKLQKFGNENADELLKSLELTQKQLLNPPKNQTEESRNKRLDDLAKLQKSTESLLVNALSNDEGITNLKAINDSLAKQNETLKESIEMDTLDQRLKDLQGFLGSRSTDDTRTLTAAFESATTDLKKAISDGDTVGEEIARAQLEGIAKGVETEESRRESEKARNKSDDVFEGMFKGITDLGSKFEGITSSIKGGGSFLAKIAPLALVLLANINPKLFKKVIEVLKSVFTSVLQVFSAIIDLFKGDIESATGKLKDNLLGVAVLIAVLAIMFGGKILAIMKGAILAAKFLRAAMLFVSGFIVALGKALIAMVVANPVGAIIVGLIAAVAAIGFFIDRIAKMLGLGGIKDVLIIAVAELFDGLSMIGNFIGGLVNGITGFIANVANRFSKLLSHLGIDIPEISGTNFQRMDTNRRSTAIQRLREEEAIRRAEEENNADDVTFNPGSDVPNVPADMLEITIDQPAVTTGFMIDDESLNNMMASFNLNGGQGSAVIAPTVANTNNSNAVTTIIQQPSTHTSNMINSHATAR